MATGSLVVVGTGYMVAGQTTEEALAHIEGAEKLFYLVPEPVTCRWLDGLNPTAESLYDAYQEGRPRNESYAEMVERILAPVRQGRRVCVALYGHPGVFVGPSHTAIARARAEGHEAFMLPGISAEDCLVADLGVDPAQDGCQSFEATDFLVRKRRFDPRSSLILWQIGGIGVRTFHRSELWNREGLVVLAERLLEDYPPDHPVTVYEAAQLPVVEPKKDRIPLAELPRARVTLISTLYVPPVAKAEVDPAMMARLGLA